MNPRRRRGYSIVLVIIALTLTSAAVFILGETSNSMLLDSDMAQAQAHSRTLAASGLAWLRHNRSRTAAELSKGIDLDVTDLHIRDGRLRLAATQPAESCEITVQCRSGRATIKRCDPYVLRR